jgi:hypothetical protein
MHYNIVREDYRHICGYTFPVWRKPDRRRGKDHMKWLYCPKCGVMDNFRLMQAMSN